MTKTNKSGQTIYPFNSFKNSHKIQAMHARVCNRIESIQNGEVELYPGEIDVLRSNETELSQLSEICGTAGIIYLTGNLLSRAKEWVETYDKDEQNGKK